MFINDTRSFHLTAKEGMMGDEQTFGLDFTINSDLTASKKSYGIILAQKLGNFVPPKPRILEIGSGDGLISRDIASEFGSLCQDVDYEAIEVSPKLAEANALNHLNIRNVNAKVSLDDAHCIQQRKGFDLIISNEMAGDLLTIDDVRNHDLKTDVEGKSVSDWIMEYKLPFYTRRNAYNIGAFRLIEQAYDLLNPNGVLFLSEHSSEQPIMDIYCTKKKHFIQIYKPSNDSPQSINLHTHLEYSSRFSDLIKVGQCKGFKLIKRGNLVDMIGVEGKMLLLPRFLEFMDTQFDVFKSIVSHLPKEMQNPKWAPWYILMHPNLYPFPASIPRISIRDCNLQFEYIILQKPT